MANCLQRSIDVRVAATDRIPLGPGITHIYDGDCEPGSAADRHHAAAPRLRHAEVLLHFAHLGDAAHEIAQRVERLCEAKIRAAMREVDEYTREQRWKKWTNLHEPLLHMAPSPQQALLRVHLVLISMEFLYAPAIAEAELGKALQLSDHCAAAWDLRSWVFATRGAVGFAEALRSLDRAAELSPSKVAALIKVRAGVLAEREGELEAALRRYQQALALVPGHALGLDRMLNGLSMGPWDRDDIESITLGDGHNPLSGANKLTNPQAGPSFDLTLPMAPALRSAEAAAEMAELYWMTLLRDVPFARYESNPDAAAASLTNCGSDLRGLKEDGAVTPKFLFRGIYAGEEQWPFNSQFLLMGSGTLLSGEGGEVGAPASGAASDGYVQYGSLRIDQRQRTMRPGISNLTGFFAMGSGSRRPNWRGAPDVTKPDVTQVELQRLFLRDMAIRVNYYALYEAYLNVERLLLSLDAPPNAANPYRALIKQRRFAIFCGSHLLSLATEVWTGAPKAVWFPEWGVHRRLRPEEYGGRVYLQHLQIEDFGLDARMMGDDVLKRVFAHTRAHTRVSARKSKSLRMCTGRIAARRPFKPPRGTTRAETEVRIGVRSARLSAIRGVQCLALS